MINKILKQKNVFLLFHYFYIKKACRKILENGVTVRFLIKYSFCWELIILEIQKNNLLHKLNIGFF